MGGGPVRLGDLPPAIAAGRLAFDPFRRPNGASGDLPPAVQTGSGRAFQTARPARRMYACTRCSQVLNHYMLWYPYARTPISCVPARFGAVRPAVAVHGLGNDCGRGVEEGARHRFGAPDPPGETVAGPLACCDTEQTSYSSTTWRSTAPAGWAPTFRRLGTDLPPNTSVRGARRTVRPPHGRLGAPRVSEAVKAAACEVRRAFRTPSCRPVGGSPA